MFAGPLTVMPVAATVKVVSAAFVSVTAAVPGFVPVKLKDVGIVGAVPLGELAAPVTVMEGVPTRPTISLLYASYGHARRSNCTPAVALPTRFVVT